MKLFSFLLFLLSATYCFGTEPFRTIAILENERMLEAEPDIKLRDYLQHSLDPVRIRALLAIARIGNPLTLAALQPLAGDKNVEIRKHVAFAVGQIRSKDGLYLATILAKDSDPEVRRLAIEAIGRIGGMEATPFVLPFLNDANVALREQAALALALIKDKSTVQTLIDLAAKKDPAQWSYVYALYRLADERSIPALHRVLADPSPSPSTGDPSSLLFALKSLWVMKKPLSTEESFQLLQNKDARVQQNALDVMGAAKERNACDAIHRSYAPMEVLTKMKAIEAMGEIGCALQERPAPPGLFGAWLIAQAKTRKENSIALLQEGMKSQVWTVRWRTAQALGELPSSKAIPLLKTLSEDLDSAVRLAALDSMTKFLPETADFFVPLLQDKDFAVRATAVDALGKTKDRKYLPELLKTYEVSQDPSEIEGRVALLDVLAEFNTSEALPVFEHALLDPEFTVRRHAIDGIKKLVGNRFYHQDKVVDPEDFLHSQGKVSRAKLDQYPKDFGEPREPVDVRMQLEKGIVVIRLLGTETPLHAHNFEKLIDQKVYQNLRIHRVVPNFVIQGGDPRGDGWGGSGEVVHDQINMLVYKRGMVGMPIAGKDTGGSQFFITHSRQPHLDGNYTIFGQVISGMEFVDRTEVGDRIVFVAK